MATKNWRKWLIPSRREPASIAPGLYHYMHDTEGIYTRFHLRVEPDGYGLLLANASSAARLSPTGVIMAKGLLEELSQVDIMAAIKARYKGAPETAIQADLDAISGTINALLVPEDDYPVQNLDDTAFTFYEAQLIAPLEVTLPLAKPALLVPILDRLWEIGIPHVTIQMAADGSAGNLLRAVERAEDLGMITGVRGRATDLGQDSLIPDLAQAGADHITTIFASAATAIHDSLLGDGDLATAWSVLAAIQTNEVYPVAEVPLLPATLPGVESTLAALAAEGVQTFSFLALVHVDSDKQSDAFSAEAMPQTADIVEEIADEMAVRCLWQPPVQRNLEQDVAAQIADGPRAAGDAAIRVEPNGDVIPPRGPYRSAGNVLNMSWEAIWQDEAFTHYRERVAQPTRCQQCPGLAICAADCPREPAGWAQSAA